MRRLPEGFQQRGQRGLRGARTFGMATHAIDGHQEHGLLRISHRNAVLVFLAMADEADIRGFDLQ